MTRSRLRLMTTSTLMKSSVSLRWGNPIRFSLCHELAHTLFPDCTREVRNRLYHAETTPVSYELEMLCNLAAAEFLLPIGSIKEDLSNFRLSIETALQLRLKYEA